MWTSDDGTKLLSEYAGMGCSLVVPTDQEDSFKELFLFVTGMGHQGVMVSLS